MNKRYEVRLNQNGKDVVDIFDDANVPKKRTTPEKIQQRIDGIDQAITKWTAERAGLVEELAEVNQLISDEKAKRSSE